MILAASMHSSALQEVWRKKIKSARMEIGPQFNKATKHMLNSKREIK